MPQPDDPLDTSALSSRRIGEIGEELARHHLEAKGYRVVATNYRCRWGEVDLIARDGLEWVFVEVRTRRSGAYGGPEESLTETKKQHLALAAQDYLQETGQSSADAQWRIDLVAIRLGSGRRVLSIQHLTNVVSG
ncbi:MAG: YraN family protein [Chloroflexota bacterium]|nr:YraN family protein [Chloroflexota bacterium]MDE2959642.1 YraN family protein [Chloroflexota bacterium]